MGLQTQVLTLVWFLRKLRSESAAVTTELSSVFGAGVQFELVSNSQSASPDMSIVIALGVLLGVFGVLVIVLGVLFAR